MKPFLCALLCCCLFACTDKVKQNNILPKKFTQKTKPSYRVGMDMNYMPYNFRDEKQRIQGLDVDILSAIAQKQNFDVEFVLIPYDLLLKEWKNQNISLIIDGIAADDVSHDNHLSVSESYHVSPDCIIATSREHLAQWQLGKVALVPADSLDKDLLNKNILTSSQIVFTSSVFLAMKEVASGNVQAAISDCTAMKYLAKGKTFSKINFFINVLEMSNTPESTHLVIAVDKNKPELLQQINAGLQHLKQTGKLDELIEKWE